MAKQAAVAALAAMVTAALRDATAAAIHNYIS
jgi:hypothetical protein